MHLLFIKLTRGSLITGLRLFQFKASLYLKDRFSWLFLGLWTEHCPAYVKWSPQRLLSLIKSASLCWQSNGSDVQVLQAQVKLVGQSGNVSAFSSNKGGINHWDVGWRYMWRHIQRLKPETVVPYRMVEARCYGAIQNGSS